MKNETVIVLDFGGQYKELIARRVRECKVYSIILSGDTSVEKIKEIAPIGIIMTGGPRSVYKEDAEKCEKIVFELGIPILGICYGMQLLTHLLGGQVKSCTTSEYGTVEANIDINAPIFEGLLPTQKTLMSHTDYVATLPDGFVNLAKTNSCPNAAMANYEKNIYGVQFHPEVERTTNGKKIIKNFLYNVCKAKGDYNMGNYIKEQIAKIREQVGDEQVVLGLSGGVDSSVAAALLTKAIPNQLVCVFVDHGLMRKNEGDEVEGYFGNSDLKFVRIDAKERFLNKLAGVSDPETKRKIIGKEFVEVFQAETMKLQHAKYLAQGTIYPDVIESGNKNSATIKSHHNVGGLPKNMSFIGLVEPLRGLFKDEVRKLGVMLGLPKVLVNRQPFPGPGLAVRIIGDITEEKITILQNVDSIFREEIESAKVKASQYFAVLTNIRSVGVMGDDRTYDYLVALRAVTTSDFMTAEYTMVPHKVLDKVSRRIANEVKGVSRVVYDITGKPPATIEWE
jgi:GMP synthase (glutamine-hydrolysing)